MVEISAGLMLFRRRDAEPEVLLTHMGGPYWTNKDAGAWSIAKGLVEEGEDFASAARREFAEETGHIVTAELIHLGEFRQPSGKRVHAFAAEGDFEPAELVSNTFTMEWPPRSGRLAEFPEVDRVAWFAPGKAREKLLRGQLPILEALLAHLGMANGI